MARSATSGVGGATSSVMITASVAGGNISFGANGNSRSFMVSDHTGIVNWLISACQPVEKYPDTVEDTLTILQRKLDSKK